MLQVHLGDAAGHVQVDADRRRVEAEGEGDYHDDAEMDEVYAESLGNRDKERGEDVQRAGGVEEAAGYQQQVIEGEEFVAVEEEKDDSYEDSYEDDNDNDYSEE